MMALVLDENAPWVFGYGSLIWRPGFEFVSAERALLRGAHRSLCIYSHSHRGTPEKPGLVFGLMRGGSCRGMAFQVAADMWAAVRDYLRQREQVTGVYREAVRAVTLADGRLVNAMAFLVDEHHAQFAGRLEIAEQLAMVQSASGESGNNVDYVINTVDHLLTLGIKDRQLMALSELLRSTG
jgi:cation transport protein ChaC